MKKVRLIRVSQALGASTVVVAVMVAMFASGVFHSMSPTFPSPPTSVPLALGAGMKFDYVVIIVMENKDRCQILTSCGGSAAYMTTLGSGTDTASDSGEATNDRYCYVHPSLSNYLCLAAGSNFGCLGYDGGPQTNDCTNTAWNALSVADRIVASGGTWKAYMEDKPVGPDDCSTGVSDSGKYAVRHNPFEYFNSIRNTPSMCSRVVRAGTANNLSDTLISDLGSTSTASNFMWLTPNNCNNMHDAGGTCWNANAITMGDVYLKNLVPQILGTSIFMNQRSALFITFDEGSGTGTSVTSGVFTIWASKSSGIVKDPVAVTSSLNHFNWLATVEKNWALTPVSVATSGATPMFEFFD